MLDISRPNVIVVSVIPELVDIGSHWKVLPPGIYDASLTEVETIYATNDHRRELFQGLAAAMKNLVNAGCKIIYIDGGYTGENPKPKDFDVCWDFKGVNGSLVDPVILNVFDRKAQLKKYKGEFFLSLAPAAPGVSFVNYFQRDKFTGKPKGIIRVH